MSDRGFWAPLDPDALASCPPQLAERLGLRPAAEAALKADLLATVDGIRRYVESELAALPAGWRWGVRAGKPIWQLQPPTRQGDECGYDLVLLPDTRMFVLTHSNHRSGDWHIERIVVGTTANILEVDAFVRFAFELRDFIRLVTGNYPQNYDALT